MPALILRLMRSALFMRIVKWLAPKVWAYIKKRYAARRASGGRSASSNHRVYRENLNR